MSKIAFVCWRPYEVFNVVRIIKSNIINEDTKIDLYLEDIPSLKILENTLNKSMLFVNVFYFKNVLENRKLTLRIKRIFEYIFCKISLRLYNLSHSENNYTGYNLIMASGWAPYFVWLVSVNPLADVHMFEDGIGSYFGDMRVQIMSRGGFFLYRLLNKLLCRGPFAVSVSRLYINRPELSIEKFPYEVQQLPHVNEIILDEIKKVFCYHKPEVYGNTKRVIFLSQNLKLLPFDDQKMCTPLERIKNKVVIRPHPKYPFSPEGFDVDTSEVSWELLASDLDNCILITNFSSALFTPNMLYENKNFTLIFLYKIMNAPEKFKHLDDFIVSFRKINPNIYVPETFEEYEDLLKKLVP